MGASSLTRVRARSWLLVAALVAACERTPPPADTVADARFLELDAPALAAELAAGRVSAERVTRAVLARIAAIDAGGPRLNSIIEINPDALEIARALDRARETDGPIGPLHGMPVALKANIDTADALATSAGSLALADHRAGRDAEIVRRLRAAGAVIVAKANLSEWANLRSPRSTSGWSSLGGQTRNPYALDRNPCGSSSGSAVVVAARIVPLAVGTETDGSIVCPAGVNGIVGIKPTRGSVSGEGIIPISSIQDIAGPMARSVEGAALLLEVLQDARTTGAPRGRPAARPGLGGLRVGVVRDYFGAGQNAAVEAAFARALERLAALGAVLVDPLELALPPSVEALELRVLLHEFNIGINAYLSAARAAAADSRVPDSLEALIEFNRVNRARVMPYFGQEFFEQAAAGRLAEADYAQAVAGSRGRVEERLAQLFETHALDVLVAPANGPAWPIDYPRGDAFDVSSSGAAAMAGYPSIAVPAELADGLPIGIALTGRSGTEPALLEIAAAFERARGPLPAPRLGQTAEE